MIHLFQPHTVSLYGLDQKSYSIEKVSAKSLLKPSRFDLFAKLVYIRYRKSNPEFAIRIYSEHIKAFNPDLKEPGRDDKNGLQDFIDSFDKLIDYFSENEFDENISLIPVSDDGTILDGSHRLAALIYFDKEVTIARFNGLKPVCDFDYDYFLKRGLPVSTADTIVNETKDELTNLYVACLWPKMGNIKNREFATNYFKDHFQLWYLKNLRMSLGGLSRFVYQIYKSQDWVGTETDGFKGAKNKAISCYSNNGLVQFVVFKADSIDEVIKAKDEIRNHYGLEKHALHISDNDDETSEILELVLTERKNEFTDASGRLSDRMDETVQIFRNVYWIGLKVKLAKILKKFGLYK